MLKSFRLCHCHPIQGLGVQAGGVHVVEPSNLNVCPSVCSSLMQIGVSPCDLDCTNEMYAHMHRIKV